MAWCRLTAKLYLSQYCPRSFSPYGVTSPQWVNIYPSNLVANLWINTSPDSKVHGANMGPVGPRWTPCWPYEPCYQGTVPVDCLAPCSIGTIRKLSHACLGDWHVKNWKLPLFPLECGQFFYSLPPSLATVTRHVALVVSGVVLCAKMCSIWLCYNGTLSCCLLPGAPCLGRFLSQEVCGAKSTWSRSHEKNSSS